MTATAILFWSALAVAAYAYVVYPGGIWILSRFARQTASAALVSEPEQWPKVTVVITGDGLDRSLLRQLRNATALDYPLRRLEILLGCDGEEDLIGLEARSFRDARIRVLSFAARQGYLAVVNECIQQATGEIVVLPAARVELPTDFLRRLPGCFRDPKVGGICCDQIGEWTPTRRCALDRFERLLRGWEARLGQVVQRNAGVWVIRRNLLAPFCEGEKLDVVLPARLRGNRHRLVYDPALVVRQMCADSSTSETSNLGISGVWRELRQSVSATGSLVVRLHQLLRGCVPAFLLVALVANACLSGEPFYLHCLVVHELLYLVALTMLFFWSRGSHQTGKFPTTSAHFAGVVGNLTSVTSGSSASATNRNR